MDDTLPIRETAEALGVSVDTVRRWANAGRIQATRTSGGHRRFRVAEIQRILSGRGQGQGGPRAAALSPPSRPLPGTGRVLAEAAPSLLARAAGRLYRNAPGGWFATHPGRSQAERWLLEVALATKRGEYGPAIAASSRLARHASIAGVSAIECDSLIELLGAALGRELSATGAAEGEAAAARRLLISLRQAMLAERVARGGRLG